MKKQPPKRPVGRPLERVVPPIPDTPENVAQAILQFPPKKKWRFVGNAKEAVSVD